MGIEDTGLLLRLQTEVLEAIASGTALASVADLLCHRAETLAPDVMCSILTVDDARSLRPLAAPSLPAEFSRAVDGTPIGPKVGSCGTAAFRGEPVVVTDIDIDPLWEDFLPLAQPLGLKACWSSPIFDRDGKVAATFAFYYRTSRAPNALERSIVDTCVHLCSIAIEHERVSQHNKRLADFDELTGLPNRRYCNQLIAAAVERGAPFGLLLVDIDHLKMVNDTLGHDRGDVLIRAVGERIATAVPGLRASRLGGDEFAVIVADCADDAQLAVVARQVIDAVQPMIQVGDHTIAPHVTIGGALYGPDGKDSAELSQSTDFALYQAKLTRRGDYIRYNPSMRATMIERANMVREVDQALGEGRILAHYQPMVQLGDAQIVGLEALARMRMPDGRIASAGEFHAALADPRIAWKLTGQMLTQIASDIRHWLDMGLAFQHVGINVTTGDFQRGDLESRIVDTFEQARVPLDHIVLEVNEAVFMGGSDQMVPKAVGALRQRGLMVALDDFGTGFASLTHLLTFPVDVIKIDRSFVSRLGSDGTSDVVVGSIIDIARKLKMKLVAEGIETPEQARILAELGCPVGQGYLYARPSSFEETTELLKLFSNGPAGASASLANQIAPSRWSA